MTKRRAVKDRTDEKAMARMVGMMKGCFQLLSSSFAMMKMVYEKVCIYSSMKGRALLE